MAIRNIVKMGDEILRKKSRVVVKFDERLHTLLDDMAETMYEAHGVGLAAPQVGILKRVVVIDVGDGLIELVNPVIVEKKGKAEDSEGCLSIPGEYGMVVRPSKVKIKAQNRYGEEITLKGTDLLARAFCHEIDHLEGVLFTDLATRMLDPSELK